MGLTICGKVNKILDKYKYAFIVCENTKFKVLSKVPVHSIELLVIEGRFDYRQVLEYIYDNMNKHPIEYPRLFRQIHKEMEEYDKNRETD